MANATVRSIIDGNESASIAEIVDLARAAGEVISPAAVLRIKNEVRRAGNVSSARSKASEGVGDKLDLADEIIEFYMDIVNDESRTIKDRLSAANDLRGWVKLSLDAAGEDKLNSDSIFTISEDWNLEFDNEETTK